MKKFSNCLIATSLLLLLVPACGGKKRGGPGPNDKIYPVKTASVNSAEIPDSIELSGTFIARERLLVKSPYSGQAVQVAANLGQSVSPGDALCRIQNDKINLILDKLRAELKEEELKQENANNHDANNADNILADNNSKDENDTQVVEAKENKPAQNPFDLDDVGDASENSNEPAPPPKDDSHNIFAPKDNNNLPLVSPPANEQRQNLQQAKIERLKAEIALAERQLTEGTIVASLGGIISKKEVSEGMLVSPDNPLFEIVDNDPILLSVFVPQKHIGQLSRNTPVRVIDSNDAVQMHNGEIIFISSEFNIDKKGLEIHISISNSGGKIKINAEGTVQLGLSNRTKHVMMVSPAALHRENNESYVYLAENNLAVRKKVDVGPTINGQTAILSGLNERDQVIVSGHETFDEEEEFIKTKD